VTPDHPVSVQRLDGHTALANSLALRLADITPEAEDPEGGTIVRDSSGAPTGILKDLAADLVSRAIPEPSHEMNLSAARAALAEAARFGVQDNSSVDPLRTYQDLRARGELTARFYVWRYASSLEALNKAGVRTGLGDEWIPLGAIEFLSDGSMGSGKAAFFAPYSDDAKTSGLLVHPVPELERLVQEADAAGFQLAVHAIGDRANSLVEPLDPRLGLYAAVTRELPQGGPPGGLTVVGGKVVFERAGATPPAPGR
jgi:predicted amidohydrolase YtcJ